MIYNLYNWFYSRICGKTLAGQVGPPFAELGGFEIERNSIGIW